MINQRDMIRDNYPAVLTLTDVTAILRISKRKAAWMLQNGYIKCKNSGKKTRQYQVKIDALFDYMDKVERNDPKVQMPSGIFSSKPSQTPQKKRKTKPQYVDEVLLEDFKLWLDDWWFKIPEMLTIADVSRITGYSTTTVQKWTATKKLKSVMVEDKMLITTKVWLIDFYYDEGQNIKNKSKEHIKLLKKYHNS